MSGLAEEQAVVRRARILAGLRWGKAANRPAAEHVYLKLLADRCGTFVERDEIRKRVPRKGVTEKSEGPWLSRMHRQLEPCLAGTVLAFDSRCIGTANRAVIRLASSREKGLCCDALRFAFYPEALFLTEGIPVNNVRFHWIEDRCPCPVGKAGHCSSEEGCFTPVLKSEQLRKQLEEIESKLTYNQNIIKLLAIKYSPRFSEPKRHIDITMCRSRYSYFRLTNLNLEHLPPEVKDLDASLDKSPLANPLGMTVWVVQVGADGKPLSTLLSWRGKSRRDDPGSLLEVGFERYDAAASSQVKLYTPGQSDLRHCSRENKPGALPDLDKAVKEELAAEADLPPKALTKVVVLAVGQLLDRRHPEILVLAETRADLTQVPQGEDEMWQLEHGKEFKLKRVVPFQEGNLQELARYLVGIPAPGYLHAKPLVDWNPEAAVCAILAAEKYFGRQAIERAVAEVIETDIKRLVPFWAELEKTPS